MISSAEYFILGTACAFVLGTLVFLIVIEFKRKDNET